AAGCDAARARRCSAAASLGNRLAAWGGDLDATDILAAGRASRRAAANTGPLVGDRAPALRGFGTAYLAGLPRPAVGANARSASGGDLRGAPGLRSRAGGGLPCRAGKPAGSSAATCSSWASTSAAATTRATATTSLPEAFIRKGDHYNTRRQY